MQVQMAEVANFRIPSRRIDIYSGNFDLRVEMRKTLAGLIDLVLISMICRHHRGRMSPESSRRSSRTLQLPWARR